MLEAVGDTVLVKPISADTKSPGGIALPASAQDSKGYHKGLVVSVGHGLPALSGDRIRPVVDAGDEILYKYGDEIEDGGVSLRLVRERDILAIVRPDGDASNEKD